MDRQLLALLVRYGAPVLFFAQAFGIFGLPIPDELLLTIAGALVRRGQLHGVSTTFAAVSGCLAGITLSYVLGRTVGIAAIEGAFHVRRDVLERVQRWFRRFGCWILAFGYFVPGVRHVTALAAGSTPLDYQTFAIYAYAGAAFWCAVFLTLGYVAGDRWEQAHAFVRGHVTVAVLIVSAAVAVYVAAAALRRSRA